MKKEKKIAGKENENVEKGITILEERRNKIKINMRGKIFEIKSKLIGEVEGFPFDKSDKLYHNVFDITITRITENGSISKHFKFYGSYNDYKKGKTDLNTNDLLNAFYYILSDGLYATEDYNEFCSNLGYDEENRAAERIYKACKKTLKKLLNLGIFYSEIRDFMEILEKIISGVI